MTATALYLPRLPFGARCAKRTIDVLVGLLFLVPLTLLLVINWLYYLPLGGGAPLVYEMRMGHRGPFKFYKLRVTTRSGQPTPLGEFFRRWGIDELGQIINILLGDMSLVGPRPTTLYCHVLYVSLNPDYPLRYGARGGLLGLGIGTVTNRKVQKEGLSHSELLRLPHDLDYIRRWSWRMELKAIGFSLVDMFLGHDPT